MDNTHASETEPMLDDSAEMEDHTDQHHYQPGNIDIHREARNYQALVESYNLQWEDKPTTGEKIKTCLASEFKCSGPCLKKRILNFLPFIEILRTYQWKNWIISDLVSGLSVSVIHIPQGMGFALLTSVPPVFGLYSSLFPVFLYFFFGTSRHISMGTMALISLMIGAVVDRELENLGLSTEITNSSLDANETAAMIAHAESVQVDIAISVSLITGIFQFFMGLVSLGVVATFMSMPFVGSFLCGAAAHIITSQIPGLFGLKLKRRTGLFVIPLTIYDVFANIKDTNVCAIVMGLICLAVLIVLKEVINEKYKSKMKIPIPAEIIVVIIGTLISHYARFNERYNLKIVGPIPKGIPPPRVPPMTNASNYIGDAFLIAIISFAISITMSKLMAGKHKYKIDVNQELYAYGISHAISAFFNCFAGAQAPPRTLVHDSIGGKTQVSSLFSCVVLLLVCVVLGPLFQSLPICVLASVIIIALLPLFKQFKTLPNMGRISPSDLAVYLVTFLSVVILSLTIGLAIGIGFSILVVIFQHFFSSGTTLVGVGKSEIYLPSTRLIQTKEVTEIPGIKIFRFDASLFFINVEKFKRELFQKTVNCQQVLEARNKAKKQAEAKAKVDEDNNPHDQGNGSVEASQEVDKAAIAMEDINLNQAESPKDLTTHTIILDCSFISYVDIMGVNMLKALVKEYHGVGIRFVLAQCSKSLFGKLQAADAIKTEPEQHLKLEIFPLVQDAVATATKDRLQYVSTQL